MFVNESFPLPACSPAKEHEHEVCRKHDTDAERDRKLGTLKHHDRPIMLDAGIDVNHGKSVTSVTKMPGMRAQGATLTTILPIALRPASISSALAPSSNGNTSAMCGVIRRSAR